MRVLLDTHTFLWMAEDAPQLSQNAREAIIKADTIVLSVASIWELAVKFSIGKLWQSEYDFDQLVRRSIAVCGAELLPIRAEHALKVSTLPLHHRDPFDRMLVAQAMTEGLPLVSHDQHLTRYACEVIW